MEMETHWQQVTLMGCPPSLLCFRLFQLSRHLLSHRRPETGSRAVVCEHPCDLMGLREEG